jgi:mRNA-degrading endonuclease toxin of MazEF toxin-antitoxin module
MTIVVAFCGASRYYLPGTAYCVPNTIATYPICVVIDKDSGMKKDSIVNLSQIRILDKRRLTGSKLATLSAALMEKVDMALKNSLAL